MRIIECASFVAAPSGCMSLGQLGADVIRVDPIGGGPDYRRWPLAPGGASLYWAALNKGTRSVAVDLRADAGRELVTALITAPDRDAGILVDNSTGRQWMSYEALSARRPDLIHVHLQGHPDGRPAVDYTVNAEIGLPGITGPESAAGPVNHVLPAWDLLAGMTVATGVLAALHERQATGAGAYIELALADVATAAVANLGWLTEALLRGAERPRQGNHIYGSFGIDFETGDGRRAMVVAITPRQWDALCTATGTGEVFGALGRALGADLTDESDRYRLRDVITAVLRPWFAARTLAEVRTGLDAAGVLWGQYRGMLDAVAAQQAAGAEAHEAAGTGRSGQVAGPGSVLSALDQPGAGPVIGARSPLRWDGRYAGVAAAPLLGQHTGEVLAEVLKLTSTEIGRLHDEGVIACAQALP
jgi:2-methylfumaryl-CoA isomerase